MAAFTTRPVIMGSRGVVTSGHYLATAAGFRIMEQGGNAIDAAAAVWFCLNLLGPPGKGVGGGVPAVVDGWALALARCGAMRVARVVKRAIELAERGFPVYDGLHASLNAN